MSETRSIPHTAIDADRYRDALAVLDSREEAMIETVLAWSRINSGSDNPAGLDAMGDAVTAAFAALGAQHEIRPLPAAERVAPDGSLVARPLGPVHRFRKRPQAPRKVLLTGHVDTVFPPDHPFQSPRFLDENTINGPGVADMKGGIVVMIEALRALEASPFAEDLGWEVLLSADEEIGSIGSAAILAERAPSADIGLTYEPALADGTLAGARKGSGNFTFVLRGRAAHAGRDFDAGRNAIVAAADLVAALDALNGRRPGVTVNPAVISGGTAPNIVPDRAVLAVNVRVTSIEDMHWIEKSFADIERRVAARDGIRLSRHGGFNRPPKPLSPANEALMAAVAACGAALGITVTYKPTGGCCEGNNLAAAGLPNVDTLGVRGGSIHSDEEFALVDSFVERARLSALILMAFADGRFPELERKGGE